MRTKIFWLAAEYFVLLPILALILIGAFCKGRSLAIPKPRLSAKGNSSIPVLLFCAFLVPLAFTLDRGTYQADENAYLFQARCINAGNLYTVPPPRVPLKAITYEQHVILNDKWFGKYPAGWPLLLSLGTATRLEWILNPLLGVALLLVTFKIGVELFGAYTGAPALWILALSAFFSLNCLGFMSHVLSGLLIAMAVLCQIEFSKSERWPWIAGAFLCLGASALVRPFSALCIGFALVAVWTIRRKWSSVLSFLGGGALLAALVVIPIAIQNRMLTGSYTESPYVIVVNGNTGAVVKGAPMREISFRPQDVLEGLARLAPRRIADTGSVGFPFVYLLAMYGLWRRRRARPAWGLALVFLSLVIGYIVQTDDSDAPIGERYYFEGYFGLTLLAAVGWLHLVNDLQLAAPIRRNIGAVMLAVTFFITAMCAYWEIGLRWPSRQLVRAADHPPVQRGIVFVEDSRWIHPALNLNTPGNENLFLIDPGPLQRAALAQTAGASEWVSLHYDPSTKAGAWKRY